MQFCPHILSELYGAQKGQSNIDKNTINLIGKIQAKIQFPAQSFSKKKS